MFVNNRYWRQSKSLKLARFIFSINYILLPNSFLAISYCAVIIILSIASYASQTVGSSHPEVPIISYTSDMAQVPTLVSISFGLFSSHSHVDHSLKSLYRWVKIIIS